VITVVIPSIPPRRELLTRALGSVLGQTLPAAAISVAVDLNHQGSATTRNRALAAVQTEWTAFLDDDDTFLPNHLELLSACAESTGADVVYSVPEFVGRPPVNLRFGLPFDADELRRDNYIPVTSLVRTELAQIAKFRCPRGSIYDDWGFYRGLLNLGAKFVHLPEVTWTWNWHAGQTEGCADRW
jgi:glycosyltransferase involved in cell wall biosynthesis